MSVLLRGSSYQATVHHQGARYRETFKTEADAELWKLQTKAALMRGETIQPRNSSDTSGSPTTLKQLMELTHRRIWAGTKGEKTAMVNANLCVQALGPNTRPAAVNSHAIDAMLFQFESEGIADSTMNRRLSALSKMLTFAHDRGYITSKPKIERKREPKSRIRYITREEEVLLLDYFRFIGRPFMCDLVIIAVDTGVRLGELERIEARDIHGDVLSVWESKGDDPRSVPLTDRAKEILERLSKEKSYGKLFADYPRRTLHTYWEHARQHLGLTNDKQFVIHALRHTFCSRLVQSGVDIVSVSKLAGHKTITMTMKYAHLAPESLRHAINKLQEAA